ncbi:hypothetical protein MYSTI_03425 [Myxococcus stipitatus DSM 14675]|uniref:Uncharacterized protein n=1 Tax=Myxococcus stipitatus (strain DSM 14675 / JCM 12634 / Mx s8) TaxID=1278073 RepID=L7UAV8_MYXSD|nr:hypothetical protein [Myxococcus stipitatus]AGC44737.1 hypothetical protein MYSTI_03425 [Myxococcus stipitatus DSM 14675]
MHERAPAADFARRALCRFLGCLIALLATSASAASLAEELAGRCRAWAADPHNPWALAHGMALDGRAFRAKDGRPAADVVVSDFLRVRQKDTRDFFFEPFTAEGTPVEPHPALQAKTLLASGIPLSQRFTTPFGPVTLREVVARVKREFQMEQVASPESAWRLDALSLSSRPGDTFRDARGRAVSIHTVMDTALATLEAAHAELAAGMKAGRAQVPKQGQGIYSHPCGGLHYFQAVAGWARHPSVRARWRERLETQRDVLLYRLDSEARQYETAWATAPEHREAVLAQMLKFHGHLLETLGRFRDDTGWRPTPLQQQTVDRARRYLENTVRRMDETGLLSAPSSVATRNRQLALDLVGDTCHAARGEALWSQGPARVTPPASPSPPR